MLADVLWDDLDPGIGVNRSPLRVWQPANTDALVQFQRDAFAALFSAANKRLREKLKFELTLVTSADEVLSSIRETTDWQLVLLDINMPGTSGAEIIADVRAALGDRVPVLMISGAADMGAVHNCLQQGADLCAGAADC